VCRFVVRHGWTGVNGEAVAESAIRASTDQHDVAVTECSRAFCSIGEVETLCTCSYIMNRYFDFVQATRAGQHIWPARCV